MVDRPDNAFLRYLPQKSFAQLEDQLTLVDLELGALMLRDGARCDWVHFPINSIFSMIAASSEGQSVETSMVGKEGAAGLTEACGSQISSVDGVIQVNGSAWRAPASLCKSMALSDPEFSACAWRLAEFQLIESRQSALCQAAHPVERRFARWMCESYDRCGGRDPLPMTQEFLAALLGVQRTTVSSIASTLQRKGLINYKRGRVDLLDRGALEHLACDCRQLTLGHRARLGFATSDRSARSGPDQKV